MPVQNGYEASGRHVSEQYKFYSYLEDKIQNDCVGFNNQSILLLTLLVFLLLLYTLRL